MLKNKIKFIYFILVLFYFFHKNVVYITFSVLPDLIASKSADLVSGTASTGLLLVNSICGGGGGGGAAFINGGGGGIKISSKI